MNLTKSIRKKILEDQLARENGIFRLRPTWVARNSMPAGQRLGLPDNQYFVGERGWISERWLGSTTKADNQVGPPDEGLSYLNLPNETKITLKSAIETIPDLLMGVEYSRTHTGLGRLPKIFDMSNRIAFHFHQQMKDASLVGRNSKEEAYYFPEGVDMGLHPETFFGVHPSIAEPRNQEKLIPHLIEWKDDQILQYSRAYHQYPDDGFHVPAGIPHAPGTALTLELQEDSDVFAILQAKSGNEMIPKELLFKDVRKEDREKFGERIIFDQIDWELSGDPFFYENRHTPPLLIQSSILEGGQEHWIFYNSTKFSGKKLVVNPGQDYLSIDVGVYNLLVWQGEGLFDGIQIKAGNFELEELFVSHEKATQKIKIRNTGLNPLVLFKFFGPDINPDVPIIQPYR